MGSGLAGNPLRAADLSPLRERSSLKRGTQGKGAQFPRPRSTIKTSLSFQYNCLHIGENLKVSLS